MNNIFALVLSLSFSGTILALFILAIKPIIKNKFSYTWQYYIWLLVILRFLLPFTSQLSIVGEFTQYAKDFMNRPSPITTEPYIGSENKDNGLIPQITDEITSAHLQTFEEDISLSNLSLNWADILAYVWLLWLGVALLSLFYKIVSYRRFTQFVKSGTADITNSDILTSYKESLIKAKVRRLIPIYLNKQVSSPMLLGFIRPQIIIPPLAANGDELQLIFHHELTHYRRLDFIYKWLIQITLCLHWFNPIIYFIAKEINQCCELSCDESVIRRLNDEERVVYGDALMASLHAQGQHDGAAVSIKLNDNANHIKERLNAIMNYKKKSKLTICTMMVLTVLLFCGFTYTGAYIAGNYQNSATLPETKTPYFASYSKDNAARIGGRGIQGNWAASDTVTGDTYSEQLDNKIAYIELLYQTKQEPFIIEDGIPLEEIQNIEGMNYMFNTSEIYRKLVTVEERLYIQPQSTFSKLSDEDVLYNRYVFNLESDAKLNLSVSYVLNTGKMAVWIISPGGKILYEMDATDNFNHIIELDLQAGLYSVILIHSLDDGHIGGDILIEGVFSQSSDLAAAANILKYGLDNTVPADREYKSRNNSLTENFERYLPFGVIYNPEQDAVYYNGERVKLFVEFKPYKEASMTYAFELCYQDSSTNSELYLEAVRDSYGNIAQIKPLSNEIAEELIEKMSGISAHKDNSNPSKNNSNEYRYVTMDATQINERYNVVAKDMLASQAPEGIVKWINECNKSQGAYMLKNRTADGYITYIYYNGGGRYPWNINVDGDTIRIDLFSDSTLVTADGYYLMYFTAPRDYEDIRLHLDNAKLTFIN